MLRKSVSVFLVAVMTAGLLAGCGSPGSSDLSGQEPYTVRIVADGFRSEEHTSELQSPS